MASVTKQQLDQCVQQTDSYLTDIGDRQYTRDSLLKQLRQSAACSPLTDKQVDRILDMHLPARPNSNRYIEQQYRQDTPQVRQFKHDAFWRGVLSFGLLLVLLVFLLWKLVFDGKPIVLYIAIAILIGWLCACAVYGVFRYGVAGVGYRYSHILGTGPSPIRPSTY